MERNDSEYGQYANTPTTMQHDFLCISEGPNWIDFLRLLPTLLSY